LWRLGLYTGMVALQNEERILPPRHEMKARGYRCNVYGYWFMICGLGFRAKGLGSRVKGLEFRVEGQGFRVKIRV
jgi:hypothetical protein